MLENQEVVDKVVKDLTRDLPEEPSTAKAPQKQPEGTVERVLNFRDRNLLIGACQQFCGKDGQGGYKSHSKLDRVTKLLCFQETIDYFIMIDDSLEDALFKWQRERNNYLCWKQYEGGALNLEELKKRAPGVDGTSLPGKPSKVQPVASADEMRGKPRPFYIPSKLDSWIQDVLKAASFDAVTAEYVTELCAKFGLKDEE